MSISYILSSWSKVHCYRDHTSMLAIEMTDEVTSCYVGCIYEKVPFFPLHDFSRIPVTHTHTPALHSHELMQITIKPVQYSCSTKHLASAEPPSFSSGCLNVCNDSIFSIARVPAPSHPTRLFSLIYHCALSSLICQSWVSKSTPTQASFKKIT